MPKALDIFEENIHPKRIDNNANTPPEIVHDLPEDAYHEDFWQRTWEIQVGFVD